ncbi:hypothetical protein M413DRAFT_27749 [Hebeloma cylindrosporum]|uniref:F-box domain-containing protein n=1 Tax=Hebeloma cylindrosporum TaxID=76867 RepID=A0A0C3CB00_HEBCY|nr:hypothetical protein M413DRAFT_27749 [Hebeloma cylindrosporum h7]
MDNYYPATSYYPEPMQQDSYDYDDIMARYLQEPTYLIPSYPGIIAIKNVLEIDMHIENGRVYPTTRALKEYITDHYRGSLCRISLWDWRRDQSVSSDPSQLPPKLVQDLCANLQFLYKHISIWRDVRFDLPLLGVLAHHSPNDIANISRRPEHLRKLAIREIDSANPQHSIAFNSLLDRLWNHMVETNLHFQDTGLPEFNFRRFPGFPYFKISELRLDMLCSGAQVVHVLLMCPYLRKMVVTQLIGPQPRDSTKRIITPFLQHLTLENDNDSFNKGAANPYIGMIWAVLDKLIAPSLKELSLGYEDVWNYGFDTFIGNSNCQLQKLRLICIKMCDKDLYRALKGNWYLEELTVQGQSDQIYRGEPSDVVPFTNYLLEKMTDPGNGGCLCPNLQQLTLTYPSIEWSNQFRRMIRSRPSLRAVHIIKSRDVDPKDLRAFVDLARARNGLFSVTLDGKPLKY